MSEGKDGKDGVNRDPHEEIVLHDDTLRLVARAEEVAGKLQKNDLTKTQLRNVYGMAQSLVLKQAWHRLPLLKARMAYAASKQKALKNLYDEVVPAIDAVELDDWLEARRAVAIEEDKREKLRKQQPEGETSMEESAALRRAKEQLHRVGERISGQVENVLHLLEAVVAYHQFLGQFSGGQPGAGGGKWNKNRNRR